MCRQHFRWAKELSCSLFMSVSDSPFYLSNTSKIGKSGKIQEKSVTVKKNSARHSLAASHAIPQLHDAGSPTSNNAI